jgi:hypothetical protein
VVGAAFAAEGPKAVFGEGLIEEGDRARARGARPAGVALLAFAAFAATVVFGVQIMLSKG